MKFLKYISLGILLIPWGMQVKGQVCNPDVTVSTPVLGGTSQTFQASNTITGTSIIQSGATAVFDAANDVTLSPNFDAVFGSAFDAIVGGGCTPNNNLPNDPYFSWQWGHQNTGNVPIYAFGVPVPQRVLGGTPDADANIVEAWQITKGSADITVALMDFGINIGHPDINSGRIVDGWNFIGNNSNYNDITGHGTNVAGILGATPNNGQGIAGVDWNCLIMPLKVSEGFNFVTNQRQVDALDHAILHGADILSMSFGGETKMPQEVEDAYSRAIDAGILLLAASGNDNRASLDYPARYSSVMGIGAMSPCGDRKSKVTSNSGSCDRDDRFDPGPWGSNYGDGLDLLAPGTLLPTTDPQGALGVSPFNIYQSDATGDYIFDAFGTSMSSPFAAGVAALVWGIKTDLKNYQVRQILQLSARGTSNNQTGQGTIDAAAAVIMAQTYDVNGFLLPNLSLELGTAPHTFSPNSTLSIPFLVRSKGDVDAPASKLTYKVQGALGTTVVNIPALARGQVFSGTIAFTMTPICDGGGFDSRPYTLEVEVDGLGLIPESNEFNDDEHNFTITGLPDLVPANVSYVNNVLSFEVKNIGNARADSSINSTQPISLHRYYWSDDATISPNDVFGGTIPDVSITVCPNSPVIETITAAPVGNPNFLIVSVDYLNYILESDETNNIFAIPLNQAKKSGQSALSGVDAPTIQVIPNPLREDGLVKFTLESNSVIAISIYDIMGAKVRNILPNVSRETGTYQVPFHKAGLAAGLYWVEVLVNGNRRMEKFVIQ